MAVFDETKMIYYKILGSINWESKELFIEPTFIGEMLLDHWNVSVCSKWLNLGGIKNRRFIQNECKLLNSFVWKFVKKKYLISKMLLVKIFWQKKNRRYYGTSFGGFFGNFFQKDLEKIFEIFFFWNLQKIIFLAENLCRTRTKIWFSAENFW